MIFSEQNELKKNKSKILYKILNVVITNGFQGKMIDVVRITELIFLYIYIKYAFYYRLYV